MKIDIYNHITPPNFLKAVEAKAPDAAKRLPCRGLPGLADLKVRFGVMDRYEDLREILTLSSPPIENIAQGKLGVELAKIANDDLAELVAKYPNRFVGAAACLPLNDMDASLKEIDRAIKDLGLRGIQITSQIMGKPLDSPEFLPLFEKMAKYDLPIWIHPMTTDNAVISAGKGPVTEMYRQTFGLAQPTTVAMTVLIYAGILDKFPKIKIITHHCGSSVPYFSGRIQMHFDMLKVRMGIDHGLKKPILDYYRMFYGDTALHGNVSSLMCGYAFFGAKHILFGTDMPFDAEAGAWSLGKTVPSVEAMTISAAEKKQIFEDNARELLHLSK